MDGNETTTTEELEQEQTETTPGDETAYTLDKQMLDQERANTRRAREELASVSELYESANERVENLEAELEELKQTNEAERQRLESQRQTEQDKLDDMDPDLVDEKVIRNIKAIEKRQQQQRKEFLEEKAGLVKQISDLTNNLNALEQERTEAQQQAAHNQAVESVLTRVESSLKRQGVTTPGQYRTEAMKMADDLVDKGERKKPANVLDGVDLMEECYLKIVSQHQKKKGGVSVDGGKSGVTSGVKPKERKAGSLDEVAADMATDKSWKQD